MQRFVTGHLEAQVPHLQIPVCVLNPTSSVSGMENKEKEGKTYQTELGFALSLFFSFPRFFFSLCARYEKTQPDTLCVCGGGEARPRCVTHQMTQLCLVFSLCK